MTDWPIKQGRGEEIPIPIDAGAAIVETFQILNLAGQAIGEILPALLQQLENFGALIADIDSQAQQINAKLDPMKATLDQIEINTRTV